MNWIRNCIVLVMAGALAGCGGGAVSGIGDLFSRSGNAPQASTPSLDDVTPEFGCPQVNVLEGTAGYRVGAPEGGARGVNHQAAITNLARECKAAGSNFTLRVGVEGRVLIGEAGRPGTFSIPLRVAVKRGENAVYSNLIRLSVTVPEGAGQASFVHVEENISLPLGPRDPEDEYEVLVGFDPTGGAALRRERRR